MDNEFDDIAKIDTDQFERKLRDKQHKEMMSQMKQLVSSLKQDNDGDKELTKFIKQHSDSLSLFVQKLNELAKPLPPNVTLNNDNSIVVKAVNEGVKRIESCSEKTNELLQKLIETKTAEIELTPTRNHFDGAITKVTARTIMNTKQKM